ncbi:MAG: hypothetical protein PVSMB5_32370 [Ktedonobacteraceae bacterium]
MTNENGRQAALQQLIQDDAIGQLRRREGLMATLGSENGVLKLDWVEGVAHLLTEPTLLEQVEAEAQTIWQRGVHHIIWAGMGGSVLTVRVLHDLGFCSSHDQQHVTIYPLDSTDPAALNSIMRGIAAARGLEFPAREEASEPLFLQTLLQDVMMVGVSMGMTSEEPITHLEWFTDLLHTAQLRPADHLLVMTLPGSYLDQFAHEQLAPSLPLQPDGGTGTGGRMSAPSTRVFLLPAALFLTTRFPGQSGQLRLVLQRAWDEYRLEQATSHPAEHPFVQLAAALSSVSRNGACHLLLSMPQGWHIFVSWLEQLMEESLGKGGKGIVVFDDQPLNSAASSSHQDGLLRVRVVTEALQEEAQDHQFILTQPSLASADPRERLAALAASFLGWQLSMALYGYMQHITFSGQPAVENYKARARALRTHPDPLQVALQWQPALEDGILTLLVPHMTLDKATPLRSDHQQHAQHDSAAFVFARALQEVASSHDAQGVSLSYFDVTINGEASTRVVSLLEERVHSIGNTLPGMPVKLRQAPAAYHSTEQSEMDGPPSLLSLRLVARNTEASLLGSYTNTFLHAQAVSTWQAMMEVDRPCFLLVVAGSLDDAIEPLSTFFSRVEGYLSAGMSHVAEEHKV